VSILGLFEWRVGEKQTSGGGALRELEDGEGQDTNAGENPFFVCLIACKLSHRYTEALLASRERGEKRLTVS
jgi:hypothetical protein